MVMEILGIKINGTDARKDKEAPATDVNVNITLDGLEVKKGEIRISFTYAANYRPNVGFLRLYGMVFGRESNDKANKLAKMWEKEKKLPPEIAEPILNLINASAGVNGVLVARSVNLIPPLVPPKIVLKS
ncbi:hypothetical protein H0O02_01115 [Candidatus Micrarchaeota archaeon]|nr:hypothetical protein [Candidatus Micrarchaeota archaeon]